MAVARKHDFSRKEGELSDFAKTLAHPARLAILMALAERKDCICGELVLDLPLAQSTVSQHLKALKDFGLIKGTVDGPRSRYCIDWKVFDRCIAKLNIWTQKMSELQQENCC